MQRWLLLPTISAPMPFQMALDDILFYKSEDWFSEDAAICRLYYSSEAWTTIGYSADIDEFKDKNIRVCKRLTGGGEVSHGKDIIFSLSAKKNHNESFSSVRMSYLKLHEAIKWGYESCGLRPRFYRCDEELPRGPECFRYPIATDLALGDEKLAGGSQKRSAGRLLHQESMRVPNKVEREDLLLALEQGFREVFSIELYPVNLKPELLKESEKLVKTKYS